MVSDLQREELRASLPDYLAAVHGVTDVSRAFRCLSPRHEDRHPSMTYDKKAHRVKCWSCDYSGDIFDLAGVDFNASTFPEKAKAAADAVRYTLDDDGLKPKRKRKAAPRSLFPKPEVVGVEGRTCDWPGLYARWFDSDRAAGREYLHARGFDDFDIKNYGLLFLKKPYTAMPEFRLYEPEADGFVAIPYWNESMTAYTYCVLRTVSKGQITKKEWRPKGVRSPLWREHLIRSALPVLCVAEGPLDAMAMEKQVGCPCMALGGTGFTNRFASLIYHTPAELRPKKVMIAMDFDSEGQKAAEKIDCDLTRMAVAHALVPPYPNGAKDANDWLIARKGVDWVFDTVDVEGEPVDRMVVTRWL